MLSRLIDGAAERACEEYIVTGAEFHLDIVGRVSHGVIYNVDTTAPQSPRRGARKTRSKIE